jgi:hypothetical protein
MGLAVVEVVSTDPTWRGGLCVRHSCTSFVETAIISTSGWLLKFAAASVWRGLYFPASCRAAHRPHSVSTLLTSGMRCGLVHINRRSSSFTTARLHRRQEYPSRTVTCNTMRHGIGIVGVLSVLMADIIFA